MKSKLLISLILLIVFSSCTVQRVSKRGTRGYFTHLSSAKTILDKDIQLDNLNTLLVVPDIDFIRGMAENIGYFHEVISIDDLELRIIHDKKQNEIGSISGKIGLSNACNHYTSFLFLTFEENKNNPFALQLKLIDPRNYEDLFIAETALDPYLTGINDQNTYNPLFNQLIKYIEKHSNSYDKTKKTPSTTDSQQQNT